MGELGSPPAWQLTVERKLLDRTEEVLGSGNRVVPISPVELDGAAWTVIPQKSGARKHRRGMWPAGGIRPVTPRVKDEPTDRAGKTLMIPLSVEAAEFSLKTGSKSRVTTPSGIGG